MVHHQAEYLRCGCSQEKFVLSAEDHGAGSSLHKVCGQHGVNRPGVYQGHHFLCLIAAGVADGYYRGELPVCPGCCGRLSPPSGRSPTAGSRQ